MRWRMKVIVLRYFYNLALQEVAKSFAITPEDVRWLNRHHILHVYHDECGPVIDVETLRERS